MLVKYLQSHAIRILHIMHYVDGGQMREGSEPQSSR